MRKRRKTGYLDYALIGNVIYPLLLVNETQFSALIDASEDGTAIMVNKQRKG